MTITFDSDPNQGTLESFGDWIVSSSWLTAAGADYGVSAGTHLQKVRIAGGLPASLDTTDLETTLKGYFDGGTLPSPALNVLYLLYLPPTTTLTDPVLGTSCQSFDGYHAELQLGPSNNVDVAYAIVASCSASSHPLADEQQTASHEFIEAATDPYPDDQPGWEITDPTSPFAAIGGEVADLCLGTDVTEATWSAQRIYSNTAAARGASPCVPAGTASGYLGFSVTPSSVQVAAAGTTVMLTLSAWGPDPAVLGNVDVEFYGGFNPNTAAVLTTLSAGETTTLQLTVPMSAHSGDVSLLAVHAGTGADTNDWPIELQAR